MRNFNFRSSADKKTIETSEFSGVDFTSSPGSVSFKRSSNAPNMIRDTPGKNKKRFGYVLEHSFPDEINGIHILNISGDEKFLVHSGTNLYIKNQNEYTIIYSDMNNSRSSSVVLNSKLIILDGKTMLSYDGENVTNIKENAYIPTIVIGRNAKGGGTLYEPINMISGWRIEKFCSDGVSKNYYTTSDTIESVQYVRLRDNNGEWRDLERSVEYSYAPSEGYFILHSVPPIMDDGEDSIMICYKKTNSEYEEIINSCNICTLYGVGGSLDRIFITGSSKYPNRDYYCQLEDPTFWGDTWYSNIGKSDLPIIGYSIVSNNLATHKANEDSGTNIILREGIISSGEPCFPIIGTYPGSNAVCSDSFGTLDNEPVYLSDEGICAITPSDVLGERSSQVRSYFLNGRLLNEENLKNASAVTYKDFYMLLVNENIYILDGLQIAYTKNEPFSHRQYEGYFWSDIPAEFLFTNGESLFFAGKDKCLYRFSDEFTTDNGNVCEAYWEIPEFLGNDFTHKKTLAYIAIALDTPDSGTIMEYKNESGEWEVLTEKRENRGTIIGQRVHKKNCENIQLRIRNTNNNSFKIIKLQLSFINGRKIK